MATVAERIFPSSRGIVTFGFVVLLFFVGPLTLTDAFSTMSKVEKVPEGPSRQPGRSSEAKTPEVPVAKPESALKSLIAGGVGGACCVLVGHPLDLIKVRMQTGGVDGSVFAILKDTLLNEGIGGLYRGVGAPILAVAPIFALSFWGYDIGQRIVKAVKVARTGKKESADEPLTMAEICVAGGISAIPATALMAPSERVKCLLQVQTQTGGEPMYNGMIDCALKVLATGGIFSLYKGTMLTLLRDVPGSIAWFGVYEIVKKWLMQMQGDGKKGKLSPLAVIVAGGLAGIACWVVAMPSDVLKSIYQTAPEGTYTGLLDVYTKLTAEQGVGALFKGIGPAMLRAFPANAACFLGMEMAKKFLSFMD